MIVKLSLGELLDVVPPLDVSVHRVAEERRYWHATEYIHDCYSLEVIYSPWQLAEIFQPLIQIGPELIRYK